MILNVVAKGWIEKLDFSFSKYLTESFLTGVLSGAPSSFQSGISSLGL